MSHAGLQIGVRDSPQHLTDGIDGTHGRETLRDVPGMLPQMLLHESVEQFKPPRIQMASGLQDLPQRSLLGQDPFGMHPPTQ